LNGKAFDTKAGQFAGAKVTTGTLDRQAIEAIRAAFIDPDTGDGLQSRYGKRVEPIEWQGGSVELSRHGHTWHSRHPMLRGQHHAASPTLATPSQKGNSRA
jgi:hypothetical protein